MNGFLPVNRIIYETVHKLHDEWRNQIMRATKFLTGMTAAILIFSMETISVFAAEPAAGINYADSGHNGTCNYCTTDCPFIDEDGDGICDNYTASCACGLGYVDENGDGICDNIATGACGLGYVDENGDGICDNYAYGSGCRNGGGHGCGRGGRRGGCRR